MEVDLLPLQEKISQMDEKLGGLGKERKDEIEKVENEKKPFVLYAKKIAQYKLSLIPTDDKREKDAPCIRK